MNEQLLQSVGLNERESKILTTLLSIGPSQMKTIVSATSIVRGSCYYALDSLKSKGLIEEYAGTNNRAVFAAKDPQSLEVFVAKQKNSLAEAESKLLAHLPALRNQYQSLAAKPGVRFYEGLAGVKLVLEDTLTHNPDGKLATFSDLSTYLKYLREWNEKYYGPKRLKLGIHERALVLNHPDAVAYTKNYVANKFTENKWVEYGLFPFASEVNIYSGKVSFVTFKENNHVAVIIENKEIYQTLLSVFELVWKSTN